MGLPVPDEVEGVNQVDDVKREVIADGEGQYELDDHHQRDRGPSRESGRKIKAQRGEEDVADGVEDAVAIVAGGECALAISLDDHWSVFENLPGTFREDGEKEAEGEGEFAAAEDAE